MEHAIEIDPDKVGVRLREWDQLSEERHQQLRQEAAERLGLPPPSSRNESQRRRLEQEVTMRKEMEGFVPPSQLESLRRLCTTLSQCREVNGEEGR